MSDRAERASVFRALHQREAAFVIPNPWDAGTARLLAALGFPALATTSAGLANMLGRVRVTREQVLANCRDIVRATDLPVSVDLENGFADDPRGVAEAIRLAAEAGAVGGSIEDATGDAGAPIYDFGLALERVHAAVEAAHSSAAPFVLTARAENLLHGHGTLDDTIRRLQAYESAGADVLYAPGLFDLDTIRLVVAALRKPLNVVMGFADPSLSVARLSAIGVRRISVGGALSRVALGAFLGASREMLSGEFSFVRDLAPSAEMRAAFRSNEEASRVA